MRPSAVLVTLAALSSACEPASSSRSRVSPPAPVEVGPVERGTISLVRTYSGTLEAPARFIVASRVPGRLRELTVDLGDAVPRGRVVARIEDDELVQLVAQARAELKVAEANVTQAESDLSTAERELARVETLHQRGVASDAQLDTARATALDRRATLEVARARVVRATAALDAARIRLGYAQVAADWTGGSDERVVAERHTSAGALVAENDPLFTVVELSPITAVIFVVESEYGLLEVGQPAQVRTDAHPGRAFEARVRRIAPVFEPGSRQARVELELPNDDRLLKPGMFIRATITLRTVNDAVIVPFSAVTTRDGGSGLFVVDPEGAQVTWRPVQLGVRQGDRVQVSGDGIRGRVVTVGQQLIEDGSAITIPAPTPSPSMPDPGPASTSTGAP